MTQEDQIPIWGYINFQVLYGMHLAVKEEKTSKLSMDQLIRLTGERLNSTPSLEVILIQLIVELYLGFYIQDLLCRRNLII